MDAAAKGPEAFAARELSPPFLIPALRLMPEADGGWAVPEVNDTSRIEDFGRRERQTEVSLKTFVAASGLQPRDLCGTHIEHPWTSRKGPRAATGLVMGLQQRDIHSIPGQQGG